MVTQASVVAYRLGDRSRVTSYPVRSCGFAFRPSRNLPQDVDRGLSFSSQSYPLREFTMPRRAATTTQADIARVIRAAKQTGVTEVEIKLGDKTIVTIRMAREPSAQSLDGSDEVVL